MTDLPALIQQHGVWIAIGLGLLAVLLLVVVLLALRRGRGAAAPGPAAGGRGATAAEGGAADGTDAAPAHTVSTGTAFRTTLRRLAEEAGIRSPYLLPWVLLIGEEGTGKSSLLRSAAVPRLLPDDDTPPGRDATLHAFESGVVIDADGALIGRGDGRAGDRDRWRSLMRKLQRHRPQRGLDGVIVTLNCADLVGAGALPAESLAAKGDLLQERLWDLQRQTGLRLPVYVIVTQCDRLRGFADFWQYTPEGGAGTMLGWACPRAIDRPFDPAEVDQAMAELGQRLWEHYVDAAAGLDKPADPDGMFRFPGEFAGLAGPLKAVLSRLMRVAPYQDGHSLRGIWFTGAVDRADPAALVMAPPGTLAAVPALAASLPPRPEPERQRILFVTDLLAEKIFREVRLSRPARSGLIARTRTARWAQAGLAATIVTLMVGLALSDHALRRLAGQVEAPLTLIRQEASTPEAAAGFDVAAAERLLRQFEQIERDSMAFPFLPSSWFSETEEAVSASFGRGLEALVLTALLQELETRYTALREVVPPDPVPPGQSHLLAGADKQALMDYLVRLSRLDRLATEYAGVTRGPVDGLADLANSLFETRLDGDFSQAAGIYTRGLRMIQARPISPDHPRHLRPVVERLGDMVLLRVGPRGDIAQRARRLRDAVSDVRQPRVGQDVGVRMQDMAAALIDVRQMLDDPGFAWLASRDITTEPAIAALLAEMGTQTVGPEQRARFADALRRAHGELRTELAEMTDREGVKLFVPSASGAGLRLNDRLHALSEHFQPALNRPFMRRPEPARLQPAPAPFTGVVMSWDQPGLQRALGLHAAYEEFQAVDLPRIPSDFRGAVDRMARQRLEAALRAELAAAQRIAPGADRLYDYGEAALTGEVRDLRQSAEKLVALLNVLAQHRMDALHGELRQIMRDHAAGMLEQLAAIAAVQSYYVPADGFAGWDGRGSPRVAGFYTADAVAMAQYLDSTRGRIEHLWDNIGAPIVDLLQRSELGSGWTDTGTLVEWQTIGRELQRYRAKAPGSTLAALEQFLRVDLDAVRLESCEAQLEGAERANSSDFFLHRRDQVRRDLLERCRLLKGEAVYADYARLVEQFNATLAGRYPFVEGEVPGQAEANPDDVALFLRDFAAVSDRLRAGLTERARRETSVRPAARFVERMAEVAAFLAPFAAPNGPRPPIPAAFDVAVDFRVNRPREVEANQIIEWHLRLGSHDVRAGSEASGVVWRPGDPVTLRLRWAKDGSAVPRPRDGGPGVEDRTAVFAYGGRWALLRMLQAYAGGEADFGRTGDPQPHTLRITVPTAPADADLVTTATGESRVYVRLALSSTAPVEEGKEPQRRRHVLPRFPASAPGLAGGGS